MDATILHLNELKVTSTELLRQTEQIRLDFNEGIDPSRRGKLGQFTTPIETAEFMASMCAVGKKYIRLLDPGAGTGALTAAYVARQLANSTPPESISVTTYEVDSHMADGLLETLNVCERVCGECGVSFRFDLRQKDFIQDCVEHSHSLWEIGGSEFDAVIMNPPYHKISSQSKERLLLRGVDIEVSNLYAAFMLLAARQLADGGEFVSITPRSFCNGPYFRRFRRELLHLLSVDRLHVYESRSETFRGDQVLQENIIVHGVHQRNQAQNISISTMAEDGEITSQHVAFNQVVRPGDCEQVIHIVSDDHGVTISERMLALQSSLDELGLTVSTGRVVDFRAKEHLRDEPGEGTVQHFISRQEHW